LPLALDLWQYLLKASKNHENQENQVKTMVFSISRPRKLGKPGKNNAFQLLEHNIIVFTRFSWFVEALELVLGIGSLAISSQGFKKTMKTKKTR
jgi:hypothetical protein